MGLPDWLRAADQIQAACGGRPGQPHEAGHGGGEVTHLHGLKTTTKTLFFMINSDLLSHNDFKQCSVQN